MRKFGLTKLLAIVALAVVFGGAMAISAQAVTVIDFNIDGVDNRPVGGVISYGPAGGVLSGSNIQVDTVGDQQGSVPSLGITNGTLSFTTGNLVASGTSSFNFWQFGAGGAGSITIMGDIPGDDPSAGVVTLLSGTLLGALVTNDGSSFFVSSASFWDFKYQPLLEYFGVGNLTGPFDGNFGINFLVSPNVLPPNTFVSSSIGSGDVLNRVPIPASALLLGSGLLGLVGLGWRRRKS